MYIYLYIIILQYESKTFIDFTRCNSSLNNNNNISNIKIKELEQEILIEKNNNIKLSEKINELEKIINIKKENYLKENKNIITFNEDKNLINDLNEKLKNLNNNLNKDKLNLLYEEIRIKDKIISNYPVQLLEGEKLLSVIFVSSDQKIHYSCICKNTDKFNKIENILYEVYPEYMESENHFFSNGNKINKYKSLDFNKIKNSDIIMLQKIE